MFNIYLLVVLLLAIKTCVYGINATVSFNDGTICSLEDAKAGKRCVPTPTFDMKMKQLLKVAHEKFGKLQRQPVPPKATSGDVCSAVIPYMPPGICSCSNNAGGANVQCAAAIGSEDTIYMISQLEVCSNPATVTITLQDGDSGYKFTESMSAGENGSIPTGIMIGVPEFGSAEIVLLYELSGNIDQLHLKLGFDLTATILFETYTCSGYSSECPLWVFDEVIPFGDFC